MGCLVLNVHISQTVRCAPRLASEWNWFDTLRLSWYFLVAVVATMKDGLKQVDGWEKPACVAQAVYRWLV